MIAAVSLSPAQTRRVLAKAGRLLDVKSGQLLHDQTITIENDKIVSIGPTSSATAAPAGATVDDLSQATVDGVEAVQRKVREIIKYGADVIKICATGGVLSKGDDPNASQFTLEEMKAIVADAHRLGRKVAAHAHGAQGVQLASEAGVDSIEHGHLMDDASIATLKKNGTYIVPTLYLMDWNRENADQANLPEFLKAKMAMVSAQGAKNLKKAFDAGLKVALGTDAAVYPTASTPTSSQSTSAWA